MGKYEIKIISVLEKCFMDHNIEPTDKRRAVIPVGVQCCYGAVAVQTFFV